MNRPFLYSVLLVFLVSLTVFPSASFGQILSDVRVNEYTFSPNDDGIQDTTKVTYTLLDSVVAIDVVIFDNDTLSVIDTLLSGISRSAGPDSVTWDGKNSSGSVVPTGLYHIFIRVEGITESDSIYRTVYADIIAPKAQEWRVEPGIFTPDRGGSLRVWFEIWDSPPEDSDRVEVQFFSAKGVEIHELRRDIPDFAGNGIYDVYWDESVFESFFPAQGVPDARFTDGIYKARIYLSDNGGNRSTAAALLNFDLKDPTMGITSPTGTGIGVLAFQTVPDSLYGWAYDRNGFSKIEMQYKLKSDFIDVPRQWMKNDTVFFSAPLADSIVEEKTYNLKFKVFDAVERFDTLLLDVAFDTTAPPPPVLDPASGAVHASDYTLTGRNIEEIFKLWIFQNGELADSVLNPLEDESFFLEVNLVNGSNVFYAFGIDKAGNFSSYSDPVTIVYDPSPGLFIPQPFQPNDEFQINLAQKAISIKLRIYDLKGDLVAEIDGRTISQNLTIQWNGLNGDNEAVHRGPLVAVVSVTYSDGGKATFREIFLFDP